MELLSINSSENSPPSSGFVGAFHSLIPENTLNLLLETGHRSKRGRPRDLAQADLVRGIVFHALQSSGVLSEHLRQLTGKEMSDGSLSERRQAMGKETWTRILDVACTAQAKPHDHPHAFYKKLRLLGIDGTTFNIANTPQVKGRVKKSNTRKGKAAFYRISVVALHELGLHNPIGVRIGSNNESEMELAREVINDIPVGCLLLGDRYYGVGKCTARLLALKSHPAFLVRVRNDLKPKHQKWLRDGSRLVRVWDPEKKEYFLLREIRAKLGRVGSSRRTRVRLWTSMLDAGEYPALELVALYSRRWEQEISFKEMKEHLLENTMLQCHTLLTATQEVAAIFLAQALVVRFRIESARYGDLPVCQISFQKVKEACRFFMAGEFLLRGLLKPGAEEVLFSRMQEMICRQATKTRRNRSCPRKVRHRVTIK
jgi:hypothetical protein